MPVPTLTTERLILRPFVPADAAEVRDRIDDYEIARNTLRVPYPYTLEHAEQWIASHKNDETEIRFAVTLRESGAIAGAVGIVVNRIDDVGVIGYWVAKDFRGAGIAPEAVRRLIAFGFEELGLNRIEAAHFTRNPASGRVMQKCGMRHEGTMRERHRKWDEYVDCELYAVVRRDWPS